MNRPIAKDLAERRGIAAAVVAPFFIALSIVVTKMASAYASSLLIAGLGSLLAVPILWVGYRLAKVDLQLRSITTQFRSAFLQVLWTRSILGSGLIISGFALTTGVKAVLLLRLEPVFVFLWSMLLRGERAKTGKIALLVALLIGSAMVVAPPPGSALGGPNLGDGLVVLSLVFLSYSYIPTEEVVERASPLGLNLLTNIFGGIVLAAAAMCFAPQAVLQLHPNGMMLIFAYALVFPVVAATLYFYAFKTLKPWIIASFLSLEVVYGLVLAVVLLKESITPLQFAGSAVILIATVLIARQR